jgi:hypothetical protein
MIDSGIEQNALIELLKWFNGYQLTVGFQVTFPSVAPDPAISMCSRLLI